MQHLRVAGGENGASGRGGDSIGAGDSFNGGFLADWLRRLDLKRCLEYGMASGRAVAAKIGGFAGQLTCKEADQAKA